MLVMRAGILIDGRGGRPVEDAIIEVDGDRIMRVGAAAGYDPPPGATVWDFSRYTMLPGLIDAHVHLRGSGDPRDLGWGLSEAAELPGTTALNCFINARKNLEYGFTTVRDLACRHYADVSLRDAINAGRLEGPRLKVCGVGLTSTAGHMDRHKYFAPGVVLPGPAAIADTPDEGRRAVRTNLRYGVDFIKINATLSELVRPLGGLCSPEMTLETMQAICEVAHDHGRRVAAHCHGGKGVTWALQAGVDVLEHGRFLTDEQLDLMVKQGTFLCPTLSPEARAHELGLRPADPSLVAWQDHARGVMYETVNRAHRAGVTVVSGSDAAMPGVTHGHGGAYEIAELVKAGLSTMEALVAATSAAARCLDFEGDVGSVQAGRYADFVLVDGDPLTDIAILQDPGRVPVVVKGGRIAVDRRPLDARVPALAPA